MADIYCVGVKTGEGPTDIGAFICERSDSIRPGRIEEHTGFKGLNIAELIIDNCRIPKENLIGEEKRGLGILLKAITTAGRMGHAALALGIAEGAYEAALKFAKERILYGKPIIELQAIQFMLADMFTQIEATRWLTYYAAWLLDNVSAREASIHVAKAKLFATETARNVAINAIKIHGGYGTLPEYHVVRYLRDTLEQLAAGGTNEIMRVIIASSLKR